MNLSSNISTRVLTGKQQLSAFVDNLKNQINMNDACLNGLMGICDVYSAYETELERTGSEQSARQYATYVWEEIKDEYGMTNYSANSDLGSGFSFKVTEDGNAYEVDLVSYDQATGTEEFMSTPLMIINSVGFVERVIDPVNTLIYLSDNEAQTLSDIIGQCQNSTTGMKIVEAAGSLYCQNQLTIANLYSKLGSTIEITKDEVKSFLNVFLENFTTATASYTSFIEFAKSIFSKIRGITGSGGAFSYGVDQYSVNTSCFIAVDTIIDIVTSIVSTVTMIFAPIAGIIVSLAGSLASRITEMVSENTANYARYLEDASFQGFGQNIFRSYVPDTAHVISEAMHAKGLPVAYVQTPLSTIIIYNYPRKNGLNQDCYPVQEFIIPFIPLKAKIPNQVANLIANGNAVSTTSSTATHLSSNTQFKQLTIQVAGSLSSSYTKRFNAYLTLLSMINEDPDSIMYCDGNADDDMTKFATWYALVIQSMATLELTDEYTSYSKTDDAFQIQSTLWNGSAVTDRDSIMNKSYLFSFAIMNKLMGEVITDHPYNAASTTDVYKWFQGIINLDPSGEPYRSWRWEYGGGDGYGYDWATIVNKLLSTSLAINSITAMTSNSTVYEQIPYAICPIDPSDPLNPSIIPPAAKFNIWARVAITLGVIAVAAVAAAVTTVVVRKAAQKSFYKHANQAKHAYDNWISDPTQENWKRYKQENRRTNLLGSIFGLGSFDAQNNWINRPEVSSMFLTDSLSKLSGAEQGEISPTLDEVKRDITNLIYQPQTSRK